MTQNSKLTLHRESGTARIVLVFTILFAAAFGAIAMPQIQQQQDRDRDWYQNRDRNRDRDRDRDRGDRNILIIGYERAMRDFGGGNGGRPSPDAQCDGGFVAVGFHVQTGEFFNQVWLDCAPMRSDGSLGEERRMTARTGSPGGRPVSDAICPQGLALRGLRGRTGASIDEAAGECSSVRDMAQGYQSPRTVMTQSVARPRAGGRPAGVDCPPGGVVTGFRSTSGEYMDHLWIMCSEIQRSY
jgi:hypothetical protein